MPHTHPSPAPLTCDHRLQPLDDIHVRLAAGIPAGWRGGVHTRMWGAAFAKHAGSVAGDGLVYQACLAFSSHATELRDATAACGCKHLPYSLSHSQLRSNAAVHPLLACTAACPACAARTRAASAPSPPRTSAHRTCPPAPDDNVGAGSNVIGAAQGQRRRAPLWNKQRAPASQPHAGLADRQVATHLRPAAPSFRSSLPQPSTPYHPGPARSPPGFRPAPSTAPWGSAGQRQ